MQRRVVAHIESWPALIPFRISGHVWTTFDCVVCEIEQDGIVGSGEGFSVYYLDETEAGMLAAIDAIRGPLEDGADRDELQKLMPPSGARNAVDAALWDLHMQLNGENAWIVAGERPRPIETVFTIGLEAEPELMAAKAASASEYSSFKIKLDDDRPVERVDAIRQARPDARLVIDANQGWRFRQLCAIAPKLEALGVSMIEQPLPRGEDEELAGYASPIPLCADESCLHLEELEQAADRYQMINIKLDKSGGLTHGLELAAAARARGLDLMVGCMGGTSLAMAPSHVLAHQCDIVDIDGPLLLRDDRFGGFVYEGGIVSLPEKPFWGMPRSTF